ITVSNLRCNVAAHRIGIRSGSYTCAFDTDAQGTYKAGTVSVITGTNTDICPAAISGNAAVQYGIADFRISSAFNKIDIDCGCHTGIHAARSVNKEGFKVAGRRSINYDALLYSSSTLNLR